MSDTMTPHNASLPLWKQRLEERGILQQALDAGWKQERYKEQVGWSYPVFRDKQIIGWHWKNQNSAADLKYAWPKGQPEGQSYYELVGTPDAIAQAEGVVYIVSGSPDLLTCHAAGIRNVLCWFNGEGSVPDTLVADLQTRGVTEVRYPVDRDDTGLASGRKVADRLAGSGISYKLLELPGELGSKYDINRLWQDCSFNAAQFRDTLDMLPTIQPETTCPQQMPLPPHLPASSFGTEPPPGLWEAIESKLGVKGKYNLKGWSENVPCPFKHHEHDDKKPGFAINRLKWLSKCQKGCQSVGWMKLAEVLSIRWQDYVEPMNPSKSKAVLQTATEKQPSFPPVSVDDKFQPLDPDFVTQCFYRQEWGDAELLASLYEGRLAYDHNQKTWYLWTGHSWREDGTQRVSNLVGRVAEQYEALAHVINQQAKRDALQAASDGLIDEDNTAPIRIAVSPIPDPQKLKARAASLRKCTRIKSVLELASKLPGVAITGERWDANPWLLGVQNGVIDLRNGTLHPGRPQDYIKTVAPTKWQGLDAPAPQFQRFLTEVFDKPELVAFMQRLLGYCVTGLTREHVLPIFWGEQGRNGKSTLLTLLHQVLGPLATAVSRDVLLDDGRGRSAGAATPHLVDLQSKRICWVSEAEEGERLKTAQVKLITGGDLINARPLYGKPYSFTPTHKLILMTNPLPHANAEDDALFARMLIIPFTNRFVAEPQTLNERLADPGMLDKLIAETPGILAWLVQGCLNWQREGLNPPECVRQATEAYRDEEDTFKPFVETHRKEGASARAREFYNAYRADADRMGIPPMSVTTFGKRMKRHGFEKKRMSDGFIYIGVSLAPNSTSGSKDEDDDSIPF